MDSQQLRNIINNINQGNYIDAKNEIVSLMSTTEPNSPQLVKYLGLVNIKLNLYSDALICFQNVVKAIPKDALSWYYLGIIFDSTNNLQRSKDCFLKVIELREDYLDAYISLFIVLFKLKEFDSIIILENKILSLAPEHFEVLDILGITYYELGDFDKAKNYLKKALEIEPNSMKALNQIANVYISVGDNKNAVQAYKKAIENDPSGLSSYNLGMLYLATNEFKKAYKMLKEAYKIDKNYVYLASLALACLTLEKWDEAIEHFSFLSANFPDDVTYKYNLSCAYQGAEKYDEAIKILEYLNANYPASALILKRLSQVYIAINNYEKATEIYTKLIVISPFDIKLYYECALLCLKCCDYDNAESLMKKIICIEPDNAVMHKDMAIIYLARKMFDQALSEFETAYKLEPDNIQVLFEFGNYYQIMSEFKTARKYYQKILKQTDDLPPAILTAIAMNYVALNMKKKALELLLKAYEKDKKDTSVLFNLGKVYFMLNKPKTALPLLEDAFSINPDIEISNMLGQLYYQLEDYKAARTQFVIINTSAPNNINNLLNLAKCNIKLGDSEEARNNLNEVLNIFPENEEANDLMKEINR